MHNRTLVQGQTGITCITGACRRSSRVGLGMVLLDVVSASLGHGVGLCDVTGEGLRAVSRREVCSVTVQLNALTAHS